jgi:hypothetical protein
MTATAISMASVANDIPASGPKPLGGCQVFITVSPPHRAVSDASHAVHPDAITEETFAFDFAIVWVHGPEDQLVTAKGLKCGDLPEAPWLERQDVLGHEQSNLLRVCA